MSEWNELTCQSQVLYGILYLPVCYLFITWNSLQILCSIKGKKKLIVDLNFQKQRQVYRILTDTVSMKQQQGMKSQMSTERYLYSYFILASSKDFTHNHLEKVSHCHVLFRLKNKIRK